MAEQHLKIPHILDPEDILKPEELSLMTYISYLRDKANEQDLNKVVKILYITNSLIYALGFSN